MVVGKYVVAALVAAAGSWRWQRPRHAPSTCNTGDHNYGQLKHTDRKVQFVHHSVITAIKIINEIITVM